MIQYHISRKLLAVGALAILLGLVSCKSDTTSTTTTPSAAFKDSILVADTVGYGAAHLDPTYANGWGISLGSTGNFWLSSNHGGVTNIYGGDGTTKLTPIKIPSRNGTDAGSPTGVVFNSVTTDFNGYSFIYSSEDAVISGWKGTTGFVTAAKLDTSLNASAVYKGLAMGTTGGKSYLYAADFHNGKIDIYDNNLVQQTSGFAFSDPTLPAGFAPFGIQNIGGLIYVTYAKQLAPDKHDDQSGAGNGYVNVFNPDGTFVKRFASQGTLNSPWGVALAPSTFTQFKDGILVSNFGDGTISGFDMNGTSLGQVSMDVNNTPLHISGIWGIMATAAVPPIGSTVVANALYFTAGPGGENHGVFGYILPK